MSLMRVIWVTSLNVWIFPIFFLQVSTVLAEAQPSQVFPLKKVPIESSEDGHSIPIPSTQDGTLRENGAGAQDFLITERTPIQKDAKVEEILNHIFQAEFGESVDSDDLHGSEVKPSEQTLTTSAEHETSEDMNERQSRGRYYGNRRRQNRNKNRRRQPLLKGKRKNVRPNRFKGPVRKGGPNRPKPKGKRVDLTKYNAYMDAVLKRMNTLIKKKKMDPLRVNLYAGPSPNQSKQGLNKKKNKKGNHGQRNKNRRVQVPHGKTKKKGASRWDDDESTSAGDSDEDDDSLEDESVEDEEGRSIKHITLNSDLFQRNSRSLPSNSTESEKAVETDGENRKNSSETVNRNKETKIESNQSSTENSDEDAARKRVPSKKRNSPRPTRGVLHGLSTLRRDGNVQVIRDGQKARVIRSRFLLGPVALEILPKKYKKKGSRDADSTVLAAATATAPQLKGVLEIRLSPGKPTRIRKLRVFPPGNIKVDGDRRTGNPGSKRAKYRKVTPMATARLRQTALQVLRQVDNKLKKRRN